MVAKAHNVSLGDKRPEENASSRNSHTATARESVPLRVASGDEPGPFNAYTSPVGRRNEAERPLAKTLRFFNERVAKRGIPLARPATIAVCALRIACEYRTGPRDLSVPGPSSTPSFACQTRPHHSGTH